MKQLLLAIFLILFVGTSTVRAETDLGQVQDSLNDALGSDEFSIEEFVNDAQNGKETLNPTNLLQNLKMLLKQQWELEKGQMLQLILLGILAGIFSNFSAALGKKELGETGFYVVYILMFGVMSVAFFRAFAIAKEAMEGLLGFMKVLVPAFALSIATVTGSSTSSAFYEMNLIGMAVVEGVLVKMVIPGTQIYFLLNIANHLMKEARFSKLADLIYTFLVWAMKIAVGAVVGFQGIQMLLYPMIDQVKRGVLWKAASGLPGVGGLFGTAAETVLGTGMVIKSAIGVGGLIGICLICILPIVKLFTFMVLFRVSGALLQPISDRRIILSMQIAADSGKLLFSALSCGMLVFMLSIAIVLQATNGML